jgi:hypothetical protein
LTARLPEILWLREAVQSAQFQALGEEALGYEKSSVGISR